MEGQAGIVFEIEIPGTALNPRASEKLLGYFHLLAAPCGMWNLLALTRV